MTRATYTDIAHAVFAKERKFLVCPPREGEDGMTVYPPTTFLTDYGVDIILKDNTAKLWMDGFLVKTIRSIQDADVIATAAIAELDRIQAERKAELES